MARPTIKKGMSGAKGTNIGEAILLWRLFLGKPELKPAAGTTNYDFGSATDKETRAWQKLVGLTANGVVDDATWAAYDARIAVAPPIVQAKANAVVTQGEANKAAAMVAAVQGKPAPKAPAKPSAKPSATNSVAAPIPSDTSPSVKEHVIAAKEKVKTAVSKAKAKSKDAPLWARIVALGAVAVAGLVGWKAYEQKKPS